MAKLITSKNRFVFPYTQETELGRVDRTRRKTSNRIYKMKRKGIYNISLRVKEKIFNTIVKLTLI